MDYSKMSDFEINMAVHGCLGLDLHDCTEVAGSQTKIRSTGGHCVDYCNNPADAWPIIKENMISICAYKRANPGMKSVSWWETDYFGENITRNDNPLRAAMIVYLQMQEPAYVQANPARPDIR